jgi:hypothetical protein
MEVGYDPCGAESVIKLLSGCVHEHLYQADICQWHIEQVANGASLCGACADHDGHDCPVTVLAEVDDGLNILRDLRALPERTTDG